MRWHFLLLSFQHLSYLETSAQLRKIDGTKESQEAIQSMIPVLGHMSTKTFPNITAYLMVSEPELCNIPKHQIKWIWNHFHLLKMLYSTCVCLSPSPKARNYESMNFTRGTSKTHSSLFTVCITLYLGLVSFVSSTLTILLSIHFFHTPLYENKNCHHLLLICSFTCNIRKEFSQPFWGRVNIFPHYLLKKWFI